MNANLYKLTQTFRLELLKQLDNIDSFEDECVRDVNFHNTFERLRLSNSDYEGFDPVTLANLYTICKGDYSRIVQHHLNDVLGRKSHLFHIVFPSIWPILTSICIFLVLSSILFQFNSVTFAFRFTLCSVVLLGISMYCWFSAIINEATRNGHHTLVVRSGLIGGFILFIVSEIMLFFGLFWAFFHCTISPSIQVGYLVPAYGLMNVLYIGVPLFNTSLLLCSSVSLTWAHNGLLYGSFNTTVDGLLVTLILGSTFIYLQFKEYKSCMFNISDGAYPAAFYMLTGLHGMHVLVGLGWLSVSLYRILASHFTTKHHLGYLLSIWYWHFVDIIWLCVYGFVYVWLANSMLLYYVILIIIATFVVGFVANS